jgi:hypothetical protein
MAREHAPRRGAGKTLARRPDRRRSTAGGGNNQALTGEAAIPYRDQFCLSSSLLPGLQ